jgi:hypothetical protein
VPPCQLYWSVASVSGQQNLLSVMQCAVDVYHGACLEKQKKSTITCGTRYALGNESCTLETKLRHIAGEPCSWITPCINVAEMDRDNAVGIATRYGLDGPWIESRWGARFSAPVQTGPGSHPASCTSCNGSFPGVKRPDRVVELPPPFSAEVKGRIELYSHSGPSWPDLG